MRIILALLTLAGLWGLRAVHYNLFHTVVELFIIAVSLSVFIIAWNTRGLVNDGFLLVVGSASLVVGCVELLHTLTYKGMFSIENVVEGYALDLSHVNTPTQLWIIARIIGSVSFVIAPLLVGRKVRPGWCAAGFVAAGATSLVLLFNGLFPACFRDGTGLTVFKIGAEYACDGLLVAGGALIYRVRHTFDPEIFRLLLASIVAAVAAGLLFTLYADPYGFLNFLGHCSMLLSTVLLYRAIVAKGMANPLQLLFRDLAEKEKYLQTAYDVAEKANRAKSIFLSNVSHEIRTPLNAIMGFAQLLRDRGMDDRGRSYLKSIESSGRMLLILIDDIIDLSRIEAGKLVITHGPMRVASVLEEIGDLFLPRMEEKGLAFLVEIPPEFPEVILLDVVRFRQILLNLVGNAVKFTPRGRIRVTASCTPSRGDPNAVDCVFRLEDSGIGIPASQLEVIFSSFGQAQGLDMAQYGGSGLGLAISRRLAGLMGGTITVESEEGKGSVFTLAMPGVALYAPECDTLQAGDGSERRQPSPAPSGTGTAFLGQSPERLRELGSLLDAENLSGWKIADESFFLVDRKKFALRICRIGEEYGIPELAAWANGVLRHAEDFNIEMVASQMRLYPPLALGIREAIRERLDPSGGPRPGSTEAR